MSTHSVQDGIEPGGVYAGQGVSICRWVNESYAACDCILTVLDMARFVRRPRLYRPPTEVNEKCQPKGACAY